MSAAGVITIEQPDTATVEAGGQALVSEAHAMRVANAAEDATAQLFMRRIATLKKQTIDLFEAPKKHAFAAHKAVTAAEARLLEPLDQARRLVEGKVLSFQAEQRRIAAEEQRIAQEAARKAEQARRDAELAALEAERKAAEEKHRQQMAIMEAQRKQDEERRLAEALAAEKAGNAARAAAVLAEAERSQAETRARAAEAERNAAEAEARSRAEAAQIAAAPIVAPVVHVAPGIATMKGVTTKTVWTAEVDNVLALVRYVAEHPEWINLVDPNMPAIRSLAKSQRGMLKIPGVRAIESESLAVSGR